MLSELSKARLIGVHPDLVRVVEKAAEASDFIVTASQFKNFIVTEGLRTLERQTLMVEQKKSKTMHSRHLGGFAVDVAVLVNGKIMWEPLSLYADLAGTFKAAASSLNIPIIWGGDWPHFPDSDHFELDARTYPDPAPIVA